MPSGTDANEPTPAHVLQVTRPDPLHVSHVEAMAGILLPAPSEPVLPERESEAEGLGLQGRKGRDLGPARRTLRNSPARCPSST